MSASKGPDRVTGPVWLWRSICLFLILAFVGVGSVVGTEGASPSVTPEAHPPPPAETDGFEFAPQRPEPLQPSWPGTGYLPFPMDLSHLTGQKLPRGASLQPLPAQWDWRDQGKVSPVGDQGACGACYAFGAIGNFESKLLIDGAGSFDFSENHAKECNWKELNNFHYPSSQPWGSCNGGNYIMTTSLFSQQGTVLESCDPYVDQDVDCKASCPYEKTVLDWRIISGGAIPDPEVLKHYLYTYGPIATNVYADSRKGFDVSYDGSYTFDYTTSGDTTNHCVLIVGWSDSLPPVRGETRPATGWIVKNSWGSEWGDNGYFYATYGAANIGIFSSFIYAWQDYDPSGEVWYYDDDGWWAAIGKASGADRTTLWGLARFVPTRNTKVTRVEFWTSDATTDVDIYLYDSFDGSAPSNLLASRLDNAFAEAGYHSVMLNPPLAVTSGDEIVVVIKFTNETLVYPLVIDPHGTIETARTYASFDGAAGSWKDLGRVKRADAAIRLRTSSGLPPAPWVTSAAPDFGVSTGVVHSASVEGRYFRAGASVKLVKAGQPEVRARNVQVANATRITCDFNLAGVASGIWDLVVTNSDGQAGTLPGGFTVVAEGQKIWKGSASDDWHGADNWTPGGEPAADNDVLVLDMDRDPQLGSGDAAVGNLVIEPGASLDLGSARLTVEGALTNLGTLKQKQVVAEGGTTQFLRITNQAGSETKYYGLDITPTTMATASQPASSNIGWEVTASISGDQVCTRRSTGVKRCFDIDAPSSMEGAVRFYFRQAERNGLALDDLVAYHFGARWEELEGPYARGGSGEGQYVEVEGVTDFSPFALDQPGRGAQLVYLPLVLKDWEGGPGPYVTPTPSPTPDVHGPYVVDSTAYAPYTSIATTYLVGRVHNPMDKRAGFVKVYSSFYDDQGNPLGGSYSYTCLTSLAPGMTSPFIILLSNLSVTSWSTYTLAVEWQDLGGTPMALEVSNEASGFDQDNAFHVTGTARNQHSQTLRSNKACVAMLNGAGKTIGVWWDNLATLDPGATEDFDVKVNTWVGKPDQGQLGSYTLQVYAVYGPSAQGQEWAEAEESREKLEELQRLIELDYRRQDQ